MASGASVIPAFAVPVELSAGAASPLSVSSPAVSSADAVLSGCSPLSLPLVGSAGFPPPMLSAICCNTSSSVTAVKCQFCPFMALGALIPAERILSMSSSGTSSSVNA